MKNKNILPFILTSSLASVCSIAQAFPAPTSGMSLFQPGASIATFVPSPQRLYVNEGWAAGTSEVCRTAIPNSDPRVPCRVQFQATELLNGVTSVYSGTLFVSVTQSIPGVPVPIPVAVAQFPMVINLGSSLTKGCPAKPGGETTSGYFTKTTPGGQQANVTFCGAIYFSFAPCAVGSTRWCFSDGTSLDFGDVDVVTPLEKYSFDFSDGQ